MKPNYFVPSRPDTLFDSKAVALVVFSLVLIVLPVAAHGAEVTLAWDANTENDIKGYKIYYGTASRNYSGSIKVGDITQTTISNFQEGLTYYFAATAYDFDDNESAFSEEVIYTIPLQNSETDAPAEQDLPPVEESTNPTSEPQDSDDDGVPDSQDAFPLDSEETLDTDKDGIGNNADEDDDNDGMPDAWEISHGLNPLIHDAAADLDGDDISNANEYYQETDPDNFEGNFEPDPPELLSPSDHEIVGLTPYLETMGFSDPNVNDVHSKTQWKIIQAEDGLCVFDVTASESLTSITVPKLILDEDTDYIWKVRFVDNHDTPSDWSEVGYFTTDFQVHDSDGNGVPDHQEVERPMDLDGDGTIDSEQADIKCVSVNDGKHQICIRIRDAEHVESIVSLETQYPDGAQPSLNLKGRPYFIEFELINFKLYVDEPGAETMVTLHLSKPAYKYGICYKYDPLDDVWADYSEYTDFSENRKTVYLYLTDGGFGDADGIANGIIVDPLAFGSDTDPNIDASGSSGSSGDSFPNISCFISAALDSSRGEEPFKIWREIRGRELSIIFGLIVLAIIAKAIAKRIIRNFRARLITA